MATSPSEDPQTNSGTHEASPKPCSLDKTPSRALRELGSREDITNTAELVAFYNAAEGETVRSTLRRWLKAYVEHFREHSANDFDAAAYEAYSRLAEIEPSEDEDRELLYGVFSSLADRARQRRIGENGCLKALDCVLRRMDPSAFGGNPADLFELATFLLSQLVQGNAPFARSTCPTQWEKLSVVHRIFLLVGRIAPNEMRRSRQDGAAFQTLRSQIRRIAKSQSYFPLRYATKLVEQSLVRLVTDDSSSVTTEISETPSSKLAESNRHVRNQYDSESFKTKCV